LEKAACPDMSTFSPNLYKKSQVWAFGTDFEWIWPFQIFGYLGVWAKKQIMAGTQSVSPEIALLA
jgi:hypothetical protein